MSLNNNLEGRNQYPPQAYPPDDVLAASLRNYAIEGQSLQRQLDSLARYHNLHIGRTKLLELRKAFHISSSRRTNATIPKEDIDDAVLEIAGLNVGGHRRLDVGTSSRGIGVKNIRERLGEEGFMVSEQRVRDTLNAYDAPSLMRRTPGLGKVPRVEALHSPGLHYEHSSDGHEKMADRGLKMGSLSLGFYLIREKLSGYVVALQLIPDARNRNEVLHVFLDGVLRVGGIAVQHTSDGGTEANEMFAAQTVMRTRFAPNLSLEDYPAIVRLQSIHNTTSEAFWSFWLKESGIELREWVWAGRGIIDQENQFDIFLFYFIWVPIVQGRLDKFRRYWNHHRVRYQPKKAMFSGHIPSVVAQDPEREGVDNYLIPVPAEFVRTYRNSVPDRLSFYPEDFGRLAVEVWTAVGKPELKERYAWEIFVEMRNHMIEYYDI